MAGSLRGTDSSGIAVIDVVKADFGVSKLPISGPMFITDKYTSQLIRDACTIDTITICHTRSATSGQIGLNEAHPFYVEDTEDGGRELVGVHNGTLTNWYNKKGGNTFKVDSEWALNHIFDEGFDAFEDFTGAYCFVWWDSMDQNNLNIALNDQRPMCIAFTDDGGMVYASEAGMISWLCQRNNIKIVGSILMLAAKHWYSFPVDEPSKFTKKVLPSPKTAAVPLHQGSYHTRTPYKDIMTRVRDMLTVVGAAPSSQPALTLVPIDPKQQDLIPKPVTKGPTVTAHEQQSARELGMMASRGEFTPAWLDTDTGELYGDLVVSKSRFMGIIRDASMLPWEDATVWAVSIIGVTDNDSEITAICGRPMYTMKKKPIEAKAETVH